MSFYKSKSVAITGADGFIGSHLTESLVAEGAKVKALVQYNSFSDFGWLEQVEKATNLEIVLGDVRDPVFCNNFLKDQDIVFHLAALIAIPYSYSSPKSYIDTNVTGTFNILNSALINEVKVIHTSTSEVYGTAQYVPIDEEHPLQPQSPYSASKIGADSIALSYFNSFDLPVSICRPFNTYGPRQSNRAVIPTIISQALEGKGKINIGDVSPTRDFNFVSDTVDGFLKVASSQKAIGQVINIGSGKEISIRDLILLIGKLIGNTFEFNEEKERLRPENSEVFRLLASNEKAKKLLNYTPCITLEEGLKQTIDWFSKPKNLERYKTDIYVK